MTLKEMIQQKIEKLPNEVLAKVFDFIQQQERSLQIKGVQETSAPHLSPSIPPRPSTKPSASNIETPPKPSKSKSIEDIQDLIDEDDIDL